MTDRLSKCPLAVVAVDPEQREESCLPQYVAMTNHQLASPVCGVTILAAALLLQEIHGTAFAVRFLQPYGLAAEVVSELLNETIEDRC